ncbi:SET domain-containing protein [Hysterangium stoloniferum]|nr:SET domain-containing protein [Hysterangium stoloniferum]
MTAISAPISPSDEELIAALRPLRLENPTLGLAKFHALLLKRQPSWTVSEKRFRKVVQNNGLSALKAAESGSHEVESESESKIYPTFRINEGLDVTKWTSKVEVKYFGRKKGKGLVAKGAIAKGETIWKEDPWIIAPEWVIYRGQEHSLSCMHCTTPLSESRMVVSCPTAPCVGRFCNRLCLAKSAMVHPYLCRGQNPGAAALLDLAKRSSWIGLHALAHQTAKVLAGNEKSDGEREGQWRIVRGFAEMGMEDRVKENGQTATPRDRVAWENAHKVFMQAFRRPIDESHQKKLAKLTRLALPDDIENELFSYEGFLRGLGRMNLNLEAHGGLYILHSHLNHACGPNVSVRHLDQRSALGRITLIALEDIEPGQELLITYVNPDAGVRERRRLLREWGFGECNCKQCEKEAAELTPEAGAELIKNGESEGEGSSLPIDHPDLEHELREGFGL